MTSRFKLSDTERNTVIYKVLPVLFFGSVIWLFSQVLFNYIFTKIFFPPQELFLLIYILANILNGILFLFFFLLSKSEHIFLSILVYYLFAFSAGIIAVPISLATMFDVGLKTYVNGFVSLMFGGTGLVLIMAILFRENFFKKDYALSHFLVFLLGLFLLEIVFVLIYGITNIILIVISTIVMATVSILVMVYGISMTKQVKGQYWMHVVFRVMASFFLLIFIVIGVLIIIAIIMVIAYFGSDSDFHVPSGFWLLPSGRPRKERGRIYQEPSRKYDQEPKLY